MELRTLRAFVEVVRQGGFSAAAKTLNATQPTISKSVKLIEEELGVPLLERLGHRSELTAAGDIVYRRALAMLAERDDLIAELDELRGLKRGVLRLGLPPIGTSLLFAPLFAIYRSRYPGVDIRLNEHGSKRLEELVAAGELDLAAVLLPAAHDFEWQKVRDEPLMALMATDHPCAGEEKIGLERLKTSPFILFESGFALNQVILDACGRQGFAPTVAARSSQIDFVIELAAAGLGVAFLPRLMAEQRANPGVRRVLLDEPGTQWRMVLAWRRGGYLSAAARAWLALAREQKTGA
ncbi:LysR family transcriptional regulator [Methylocella silvestris]|uniref:LysR family transcriptional regulator n=1 Tax=Methylocella silvestris TaxID=199596 RepID=A0A2J7TM17_METSI|nr:LysR family transcriptional regulator [Methylocella silvestris]PNG27818.1 LysR family transcriptional regulator [Methylocella silvestris]